MDLLREKRIERGLTQKELAKELGVSTNTLTKWENRYSRPSRKSIKMLSDYFDVPARMFINELVDAVNSVFAETDEDELWRRVDHHVIDYMGIPFEREKTDINGKLVKRGESQ